CKFDMGRQLQTEVLEMPRGSTCYQAGTLRNSVIRHDATSRRAYNTPITLKGDCAGMNVPKPHNAQEAAQQARVLDRANRLFQDGYRASYLPEDDVILITSDEGNTYRVGVVFEDCTCPFYAEHDYCKHALGAQKLLRETVAEQKEIEEAEA